MKIKPGDKVRFLNEKGEGTVTKIISKTTVGVTVEDGFEIPFTISELIVIAPEGSQTSAPVHVTNTAPRAQEAQAVYQTAKKNISRKEPDGIYLAFSPEKVNDIAHTDMNVWLINHTGYKILFSYSIWNDSNYITLETGSTEPFESVLLETIDKKDLADQASFKLDVIFYSEQEHDHQPPFSEVIRIKPVKLYKENAFAENSFISERSMIIDVHRIADPFRQELAPAAKSNLSKILFQKQTHSDAPKRSKPHANHNPANEMEIDLHIEELLDDYSRMSNAEIIQVQLRHFQKALDKAITERYRKLVVIHGVGNGRLKQEVRNIISANSALRFYDGSYARYGFGATEIVII